MEKLTFEQQVRFACMMRGWTLTDLCKKVTEKTGRYCDHSLLGRIFRGEIPGNRAIRPAICEILELDSITWAS